MRIQVMPLGDETVGEYTRTLFVLVIDQIVDEVDPSIEFIEEVKEQTGATAVIVAGDTDITVGTPLTLTDEQHARIIDALKVN